MADFISIYDQKPSKNGWYPVLICFEPAEGFLPDADYWNGKEFITDLPVLNFIDIPFDSEFEAIKFAEDNDPNW